MGNFNISILDHMKSLDGMKSTTASLTCFFRVTRWPAEGLQNEVYFLPEARRGSGNYTFSCAPRVWTTTETSYASCCGVDIRLASAADDGREHFQPNVCRFRAVKLSLVRILKAPCCSTCRDFILLRVL